MTTTPPLNPDEKFLGNCDDSRIQVLKEHYPLMRFAKPAYDYAGKVIPDMSALCAGKETQAAYELKKRANFDSFARNYKAPAPYPGA